MTPAARRAAPTEVPGLAARRIAADIVDSVLRRHRPLDLELEGHPGLPAIADRDRGLVRMLTATTLRRVGTLRHVLGKFLERGLPADAPRVETALLIGAAHRSATCLPEISPSRRAGSAAAASCTHQAPSL